MQRPTSLAPDPDIHIEHKTHPFPHSSTLRLLPLVGPLEQPRQVRGRLVVGREHIVHILLVPVVLQLAALLDPPRHLFLDLLDVLGRSVRVLE